MNAFVNNIANQEARTANGMKARASTANACVDLFYKIGASRGKDIIPSFVSAYVENSELALRIALWVRDARGGAGERQIFRDILSYLEKNNFADALRLLNRTPELGRWDDVLTLSTDEGKVAAHTLIAQALQSGNGLCAKWMPRKGQLAVALRNFLRMSPKAYRKMLVGLTNVVESQMCAKQWDEINFSHVPSLAAARYRKAFTRNTGKFAEYVQALVSGEAGVKVNAGAVYPYDVLKSLITGYGARSLLGTELDFIVKQWEALPDYLGDNSILPMIDVSGSMTCPAGGYSSKSGISCLQVAVSLGLYCADKQKGDFNGTFLTFSERPELCKVSGNIVQKVQQISSSHWGMNTNLHAAVDKILSLAVSHNVPQEDMPKMLLIFSDMQFDACARFDDSAMQMFSRKFEQAGYVLPKIVFWNINAHDNVPVKSTTSGVAMVSGFSPALLTALLAGDLESFTPESIMLKTVMSERYDI